MATRRPIVEAFGRWLEITLLPYGGLGLLVIAFFDSSFLSLPEINDLLVMTLSMAEPDQMPLFASSAATGSVLGSFTLHSLGKQGGLRLLQRKLSAQRIERLQGLYRRFDVLVVLVPSMLPPPCPFKIFVLGSGVFGMPTGRFLAAVSVGRATRYFVAGWLAVRYGPAALRIVQERPLEISGSVLAVALSVVLVVRLMRRRQTDVAE